MLLTLLQDIPNWQEWLGSTLGIVFKGLLIGILASAPMGPVGILIVNRSIQKGRRYGMATGVGAALSDIIYALITGLGMSFVMNFINDSQILFFLKLVGSGMLMFFGIYMFRADPTKGFKPSQGKNKGSLFHNMFTGFLLTISNPLIIFLFTAVYALLTFVVPHHAYEMSIGYASIFAGAMLWWIVLTWIIARLKANITVRGMRTFNHLIGAIVMVVSLVYAAMTIFNLSLL